MMAKGYNGAIVEVINWEKFNPRSESKQPSWFRFENDFLPGHTHFAIPFFAKSVCILIWSLISKRNGQQIALDFEFLKIFTQLTETQLNSAFEILEEKELLHITRTTLVRPSYDPRTTLAPTDGRTDGRTDSNCPLFQIWNQNRGSLPEAKALTPKRKKLAEARWKESPSTEYWTEVIIRITQSSFCRGEKSSGSHSNWKADFDFLLKPDTHVRVSEGKYDDSQDSSIPKLKTL